MLDDWKLSTLKQNDFQKSRCSYFSKTKTTQIDYYCQTLNCCTCSKQILENIKLKFIPQAHTCIHLSGGIHFFQ